jgi:hypothetical protein
VATVPVNHPWPLLNKEGNHSHGFCVPRSDMSGCAKTPVRTL